MAVVKVTSENYDEIKNSLSWKRHKDEVGQEFSPVLPVYYDAWLNDNAIDPILSIVNEIINQLDLKDEIKGKPEFKEVVKGVAIPFIEKKTGVNIESVRLGIWSDKHMGYKFIYVVVDMVEVVF